MGLTSQLIPTLLCLLLVYTSGSVHNLQCGVALKEIIRVLRDLTEKHECNQLPVADVFTVPKNTTKNEILCRAKAVLEEVPKHLPNKCNRNFTRYLRGIKRAIGSMTNLTSCPVNKDQKISLKDFLERLKTIMQEKYSKCAR